MCRLFRARHMSTASQPVSFGLRRLNHHRTTLKTVNQSQRIVKIARFIVRTRIPMGPRTLSTMSVSSVLGSLPELGNL